MYSLLGNLRLIIEPLKIASGIDYFSYNEPQVTILSKFTSLEWLGHHHAYQNYKDGQLINILEEDGTKRNYKVHNVQTSHDGIIAKILVPVTTKPTNPIEIKLLFSGTNSASAGIRNLQHGCPGHHTLQCDIPKIDNQLVEILGKHVANNQSVKLTIAGHSLGGADSQNYFAHLMQKLDNCDKNQPLAKIKQLTLGVQNSTGVLEQVAHSSHLYAENLSKKGITLEANFQIVAGDGIQQTGESSILNNVDPKCCKVNLIKIKNPKEGAWKNTFRIDQMVQAWFNTLEAHSSRPFITSANPEYTHYCNTRASDRAEIKNKLTNKTLSHPSDNRLLIGTQTGIYHFFNNCRRYASAASEVIKNHYKRGTRFGEILGI